MSPPAGPDGGRASSPSSDALLIARREVTNRFGDRAFRISTVVTLLIIVAIAVLPKLLAGDTTEAATVGTVGRRAEQAAELVASIRPDGPRTDQVAFADDGAARRAVADGDVDVAVLTDGTVLGRESVDAQLGAALQQAWAFERLVGRLSDLGLDGAEVSAILAQPPPAIELTDPPDEARDRRVGFTGIGAILMFMQLIGFGVWVAMSIVEDKSSQVIEMLLAKVSPRALLTGKVLGIGLVGVGQFLAMVVVGLTAFTLADRFPVPPGVWPMALVLLVAFVLAFVLYASLYAIGGALAARTEDVQSTTAPFTFLMGGAYVGALAALDDPGSTLARVLSFVPFSAPLVMPLRIAEGTAAWWEVAGALAAILVTAGLLLRLADRAYRGGALQLRRKGTFRELFARRAAA